MFTVSRIAKSSLLVLLTVALTTSAYARGADTAARMGRRVPACRSTAARSRRMPASLRGMETKLCPRDRSRTGSVTIPSGAEVVHPPVAPQGAAK